MQHITLITRATGHHSCFTDPNPMRSHLNNSCISLGHCKKKNELLKKKKIILSSQHQLCKIFGSRSKLHLLFPFSFSFIIHIHLHLLEISLIHAFIDLPESFHILRCIFRIFLSALNLQRVRSVYEIKINKDT